MTTRQIVSAVLGGFFYGFWIALIVGALLFRSEQSFWFIFVPSVIGLSLWFLERMRRGEDL